MRGPPTALDRSSPLRLAIMFNRLGPYHVARLNALRDTLPTLTAIEFSGQDWVYSWPDQTQLQGLKRLRLFPHQQVQVQKLPEIRRRVAAALADCQPHVVAIPGWSNVAALAALAWCARAAVPAVLMCDSWQQVKERHWWTEIVKRSLVGMYTASLVAGTPHAQYVHALGMPNDRVFLGYDAIDNAFFQRAATSARQNAAELRRQFNLPAQYFLTVARLIPEKNVGGLLRAYSDYTRRAGPSAWPLVVVGDGPLKSPLHRLRTQLGLDASVQFVGFEHYEQLPVYYGLAQALVLPSISETWGLVVNEAMASGLPVIVSRRCGCARDLVRDGVNGLLFDPQSRGQLSQRLLQMWREPRLPVWGRASRQIIQAWGPARFAEGLHGAARLASRLGPVCGASRTQQAALALAFRRRAILPPDNPLSQELRP